LTVLKSFKPYAIGAVVGAVVCFCIIMAVNQMLPDTTVSVDNTYLQQRLQLEAKAKRQAEENKQLSVKVQALTDTIELLKKAPTQISYTNAANRIKNWHLPNDSATALLFARLAAEDTNRLRYVYRNYTVPGKAD